VLFQLYAGFVVPLGAAFVGFLACESTSVRLGKCCVPLGRLRIQVLNRDRGHLQTAKQQVPLHLIVSALQVSAI
jgi:hypothetical protein